MSPRVEIRTVGSPTDTSSSPTSRGTLDGMPTASAAQVDPAPLGTDLAQRHARTGQRGTP